VPTTPTKRKAVETPSHTPPLLTQAQLQPLHLQVTSPSYPPPSVPAAGSGRGTREIARQGRTTDTVPELRARARKIAHAIKAGGHGTP
jgi:hypothetical protein